ncbi:MAG: M13 family metallopeptidase [Porphyromonadaceae bacterium]|nr:M13 family metallopeptidase [Porphyromonadaceae bacterium]
MKKIMMLSFMAALLWTACSEGEKEEKPIALSNFDLSVAPGEDFYQYACGGWMANNPLKPEYSRYGSFDRLSDLCEEQLHTLVGELSGKEQPQGSLAGKVRDLYNLGMDSVRLNAEGMQPIVADLERINGVQSLEEIPALMAQLQVEGMSPFFSFYVGPDNKDSRMNLLSLYQGGIAMGDRDYYLATDSVNAALREAYKNYVEKLFVLAGYIPDAATQARESVLDIETTLAQLSYAKEELRNPQKNYNKLDYSDFLKREKGFEWETFFRSLGIDSLSSLDAGQLAFIDGFDRYYPQLSLQAIKDYLTFGLLNASASYLSDEFYEAKFDFYGRTLSGRQEPKARWKRSLATTDDVLSEALGEIYVAKYFPQESKDRMLKLVSNLQESLHQHIENLEWMSDETKTRAHEKLSAITVKIGYPDKWRDYTALEISPEKSYWENLKSASRFECDYMLNKIGKEVDKSIWYMSPQTVNAYYNPTTNEICFPAGILQPPFFYADADDAVNYGAIGVVIGHEMTHGFDDMGRQFDKEGNLNDWWTAEDARQFNLRADILASQYSNIVVLDTVHANGRFTLGENIADQGGLRVAYTAFQKATEGEELADIDGFTPDQRFYIAYANLWAGNIRDEEILRRTKMDPHSLGKWRVNAALKNIDTFYKAFDITPEDPMYMNPDERVVIW